MREIWCISRVELTCKQKQRKTMRKPKRKRKRRKHEAIPIHPRTRPQITQEAWTSSCGHKSYAKAVRAEILKLYQLLKRSFSVAYSNTVAAAVPGGAVCPKAGIRGPTVQIHVRLQWGADACPVFLKLTLNGILCISASEPHSLYTQGYSTHLSL